MDTAGPIGPSGVQVLADLTGPTGPDRFKIGCIPTSRFNIVTSVNRDSKRLIVTVMGGESANGRNAHVQQLIQKYLPAAARRGGMGSI